MNYINKEKFIEKYSKSILQNKATVFLGAGINIEAGLPDWKNLLDDILTELNLKKYDNIDIPLVTQFYINEKNGSTKELLSILDEKINSQSYKPGKTLETLIKLPIKEFWTTNYDSILEQSLENEGKKPNIIYNKKQFYNLTKKYSVFKIHGDIKDKNNLVLWKESYDLYEKTKKFFWDKLSTELINKNFLFIGTSMTDPNLNLILNKANLLIEDNADKSEHFIFFEQKNKDSDKNLFNHQINYLNKSFNIKTVLVDSYNELPEILDSINKIILQKNIFISGAAETYAEFNENNEVAKNFLYNFAYNLCKNDKKIISGFGKGIGDFILSGSIKYIRDKNKNIDEILDIWPFPQNIKENERKEVWTEYRQKLINKAGVVIFVFGNKLDSKNKIILSEGMIEEFEIAKSKNKIIIPIASTGYASNEIFKRIEKNIEDFSYLKNYIEILKTEKNQQELIKVILKILKEEKNETI